MAVAGPICVLSPMLTATDKLGFQARIMRRMCARRTETAGEPPDCDAGLEQDFNSLDNQREAAEAYVKSQAHEGWTLIRHHYDDGGFSGGSMERPALQKLLEVATVSGRR